MELLVEIILGVGIFPSLTALSASFFQLLPSKITSLSGPLNLLKIGLPIIGLYLVINRIKLVSLFGRKKLIALLGLLLVGTVATIIAGLNCGFPKGLLREWFAILAGAFSAAAFMILPEARKYRVAWVWVTIVGLPVFMDALAPSIITALYQNIFDPNTRILDEMEVGAVVTGIFGRQSLAKLLVWTPWLLFVTQVRNGKKNRYLVGICIVVFSGIALATSQRGPFLAGIAAIFAYFAREAWIMRRRDILLRGIGLLVVVGLVALLVTPRELLLSRVGLGSLGEKTQRQQTLNESARGNSEFRVRMALFSLEIIKNNPWGNACIATNQFLDKGITHFSHAHNMLLQQFRERGWIWGLLHLLLWVAAWRRSFFSKRPEASALFGLITSIWVCGLFDHPWSVLNHSVLLWVSLMFALV